jgi:hypothetical protein
MSTLNPQSMNIKTFYSYKYIYIHILYINTSPKAQWLINKGRMLTTQSTVNIYYSYIHIYIYLIHKSICIQMSIHIHIFICNIHQLIPLQKHSGSLIKGKNVNTQPTVNLC